MSERDVLERAAAALRSSHSGQHAGSGFTRARIMATVHRRRRRTLLRWIIFAPVVSALVGGSAWAQSTGKWPQIWQTLAAVVAGSGGAPEPARSPARVEVPRAPRVEPPAPIVESPEPSHEAAPATIVAESAAAVPAAPVPAAPVLAAPASAAQRSPRNISAPREIHEPAAPAELASEATEPGNTAPELPADADLRAFRAAHELHVSRQRPLEAVAAFEKYLAAFPRGRFVPEAKYNIALNLIRAGDKPAARRALEPFAAGIYGEYRRDEARRLLDALR